MGDRAEHIVGFEAFLFQAGNTERINQLPDSLDLGPEVFRRDMLVMTLMTLSLFVIGFGFRGPGRINRVEGAVLLAVYLGYTACLVNTAFGRSV